MRKQMIAKWVGIDAKTGFKINVGDNIIYDTDTGKAYHYYKYADDKEHGDDTLKFGRVYFENLRKKYEQL